MAFISPLQYFPIELLCEIFHYYSATECAYTSRDISDFHVVTETALLQDYQRTPRWLAVLLVCSTWYHAAIRHQPLWTRLDFNSAQLTEIFLARAGSRPLDVAAFLPRDPDLDALRLALAQFQRIRTLLLFAWDPEDLISILEGYRFAAAPMLETLMLTPDFCKSYEDEDSLPDGLSGGSRHVLRGPMPHLQSLYVRGFRVSHIISGRPEEYPSLRHLRMDHSYNFFLHVPLQWFSSQLEELTHLDSLILDLAIPDYDSDWSDSDESGDEDRPEDQSHEDELHVRLPEKAAEHTSKLPDTLTKLEILDEVDQIDRFFQYTEIPPSSMLRLKIWLIKGTLNVRATRLRRLCSRIPVHAEAPLAVLEVRDMWHFIGWEDYVRHSMDASHLGRCRLDVNFLVEANEINTYPLFARAFFHGLNLRSTVCLIFGSLAPLDVSNFFSIFQPTANVREIRIGPEALTQVLTMVFALPALWPALEAITVKTSCHYLERNWFLLAEALQSRKRQGTGIQSLQVFVDTCPHPHEAQYGELALLRRFVPTVVIHMKSPKVIARG